MNVRLTTHECPYKLLPLREKDPLRSVWTRGDQVLYNAGALLSIKKSIFELRILILPI